jgi:hypothetical protein
MPQPWRNVFCFQINLSTKQYQYAMKPILVATLWPKIALILSTGLLLVAAQSARFPVAEVSVLDSRSPLFASDIAVYSFWQPTFDKSDFFVATPYGIFYVFDLAGKKLRT